MSPIKKRLGETKRANQRLIRLRLFYDATKLPPSISAGYDNLEERRVITGPETNAARTLHEGIRTNHGGTSLPCSNTDFEVSMKRRIALYVLLLLMPTTGCAQGGEVNANRTVQPKVDALLTKLVNKEIGKVEILQIPARVFTRTRITPDMLEKQFHYKLTIRDVRGGVYEEKLTAAAKSVIVQP